MNYEKKYKEALERAKKAKNNVSFNAQTHKVLDIIFPELNESEDERIRKELITHCRNTRCVTEEGAERIAKWIAWLEKQGTSYTKRDVDDAFVEGMALTKYELEKQGEQKPLDYENANIQQKDFAPKATTANRQLYNRAILKILSDYVEKYPDIRFGQMLCNLDVNPHFDEESRETYWNLSKTINKQNHE